jgi:hypothetical protein
MCGASQTRPIRTHREIEASALASLLRRFATEERPVWHLSSTFNLPGMALALRLNILDSGWPGAVQTVQGMQKSKTFVLAPSACAASVLRIFGARCHTRYMSLRQQRKCAEVLPPMNDEHL